MGTTTDRQPRSYWRRFALAGLLAAGLLLGLADQSAAALLPTELYGVQEYPEVAIDPLTYWDSSPTHSRAGVPREGLYLAIAPRANYRATNGPNRPSTTYTVESGDSLWAIANRFETSVAAIIALNPDLESTVIHPGDQLLVVSGWHAPAEREDPDGRQLLASRGGASVRRADGQAFVWPLTGALLSAEFGEPRTTGIHEGLDLAVPSGTPAAAVADGIVTFAGWDGGYGYVITLDHGGGLETRYAHASQLLVAEGDVVRQGTYVILVGATGNSTGPHLHLEVWRDGAAQDPRHFLP